MIKTATIEDSEAVTKLAFSLWHDNIYEDLKIEMEKTITNKNAMIALYFDNGIPVGFAQCQLRYDYVEGTGSSPAGYLEGIFVDAGYRRKGIAKKLLRYCEMWAKARGCAEFGSDCELDNTDSYHFHLKAGFIEANRLICFKKKL